ncbi:MAG: bifunctional nuclease family protein [Dysgonamonadaceae bacterium]|jgi:bifunctional DNase/RNase|nr:bifunctional nuclease family protein [Dysgonamonadaceae bacterium]
MIRLKIVGLTFSQVQAGAYALILAEEEGSRRIPIIIGTPEAQSIAIYLEGLNPPRPLTHDFFIAFAQMMNVRIKHVYIHQYTDGIYHSQVIFETEEKVFAMEARTSDAVALAVRSDAPIFIADEIMNEVGIILEKDYFWEEPEGVPEKKSPVPIESLHPEDLQKKLNEAIAREDFEKASYLRDLIHKRRRK